MESLTIDVFPDHALGSVIQLPRVHLACPTSLVISFGVGLAVYFIFKRYQPLRVQQHFWLLAVPPLLLAQLVRFENLNCGSARAVLLIFAVHLGTVGGATLVYRIGPWHPLAQYPGPFLHKLSKFSLALTTGDGTLAVHLKQLHEKFGDVVRIGPNELSVRDASAIVSIMGPNGLPKGFHWAGRNMTEKTHELVTLVDIKEHTQRRRPWARAFRTSALKEYEPILARRTEQLVEVFGSYADGNKIANLSQCIGWFTYDFMSDMAFGGGSEQMRNGDRNSLWVMMEQGLAASQLMGHCPWLGIYAGYIPFAARMYKQLLEFGEECAMRRIKEGSLTRDLFYYLNNEDGAEKVSPPVSQVAVDGTLAVIAGSDTSSSVLANLFYCILTHPDVYERLQAEVDAFFPPGENALDVSKHAQMTYLNAVINETMRFLAPLASGSQRATTRETGGRMAGPYYIPPETAVSIPTHVIHRDPRNFSPKTESFWPERWLIAGGLEKFEGLPGETFVHNENAFIPFSYGPAACVGKVLAVQEIRMVACLVLQRLHLRLADGWDPKRYLSEITEYLVLTKPYLPVVAERRPGPGVIMI